MGFKINIDGLDLTFESTADAVAFVRELRQPTTDVQPAVRREASTNGASSNGKPPNKSFKAVMDKLNGGAKNMLKAVITAPESTVTARELTSILGLDGSSLGGTRASFSKFLTAHRYNPEDYLKVTGGPGEKVYRIPQDKVAEMRTALRL